MAIGDYTLLNLGTYDVSGAALKTTVDTLNITAAQFISGARVHIVPADFGQVQVIQITVADQ